MKRITLAMMVFGMTAVAHSQTPPVPPVPPVEVRPAPTSRPAEVARPMKPLPPLELQWLDRDQMERALEKSREMQESMKYDMKYKFDLDREALLDKVRIASEDTRRLSVDSKLFADEARRLSANVMADQHIYVEDAKRLTQEAMMERGLSLTQPPRPMAIKVPPMSFHYSEDAFGKGPPAPWAQGEPGDSLYRIGYDAHSRGDYRRAATTFAELVQKFPRSRYAGDAMYWEAFDRYRLGSTQELETAAKVLESMTARAGELSRRGNSEGDVAGLKARVYRELARRGNSSAQGKLQALNAQYGGALCDREEQAVRTEALQSLTQSDAAGSNSIFKQVLGSKDECSADLRKNAVVILARRTDAEAVNMIIGAAKSDPNIDVRTTAISFLPRLPGDAPGNALDDILKGDTAQRIQSAAVRALLSSDNPKMRLAYRSIIERKDVSERLRLQVVNSMNPDRTSAEDIAWLRGQYAKTDNDGMRSSIIDAVGRFGGSDNEAWIMALARNSNETPQARSAAWSRVMRMNLPISELSKLYDAADTRGTREQVIRALDRRTETEAVDKLIDIAKTTTDANARRSAVNALLDKKGKGPNDPRINKLLEDLFKP